MQVGSAQAAEGGMLMALLKLWPRVLGSAICHRRRGLRRAGGAKNCGLC